MLLDWLLKLVTALLAPLVLGLLLIALGLLWRRWVAVLGLLWILLWSSPWVAISAARHLEAPFYPLRAASEMPQADAIVLLGGAIAAPVPGFNPAPNMDRAADRLWTAHALWRAGKAPYILISAGAADPARGMASEAATLAAMLREMGVPQSALLIEEQSRTTRGNARYSLPLLRARGARTVLLVSSIWHLRRALPTFEAEGPDIRFLPVGCDPLVVADAMIPIIDSLPNAEALGIGRTVLKEWLGLAWMRVGGS